MIAHRDLRPGTATVAGNFHAPRIAALHGVQRIAQQIDQHLLYAIGIAPGAQLEIRGLSHDHDAALGNARLHEGQSAIDHLGQFNRLGLAGGLAGKVAQLPGNTPHALGQLGHALQIALHHLALTAFQKALTVAGQRPQGRQGLIQLMGHFRGELTDDGQFACLYQLVLRRAQRGLGLHALHHLLLQRPLALCRSAVRCCTLFSSTSLACFRACWAASCSRTCLRRWYSKAPSKSINAINAPVTQARLAANCNATLKGKAR
jgi:hypothetical protein